MSRLTDLLRRVSAQDAQLGSDLEREFRALSNRRAFGLNFERHQPEAVELPGRVIRKNDKVRVLPPRGSTANRDSRLWRVSAIHKQDDESIADLTPAEPDVGTDAIRVRVEDLVYVAEFRDPIYPGLTSTGRVERSEERPFHAVINAENFHALQALLYTHRGRVDCIYLDPPYNTRDKDWKYNNDYVDSDDLYRHSKWLAFMERRLLLAKELLNPEDSVLIVTIDEKEYLRLGLLLEQVFSGATIQMVSSVINPKGSSRGKGFRRADEYLFFVMLGDSAPARLSLGPEWSASARGSADETESDDEAVVDPGWTSMMRRGSNAARSDRPTMFYPIYADPEKRVIVEVGEPLPEGVSKPPERPGLVAILPIRSNGSEGRWQVGNTELLARMEQGRIRLGRPSAYGFVVNYLPDGAYEEVLSERFTVLGRADDGSLIAEGRADGETRIAPTQWKIASHNASEYGTSLLNALLPDRSFPFPKSLYAVEDALRFFVINKPDATIIDFFAGSGTTAHAVMRLNHQDGGYRQSISITNNEVAAEEAVSLRASGLRPGDADWEAMGICDFITKPRIAAAIMGVASNGEPIKGDYKFIDEFPMSEGFTENVEFFTMTYNSPAAVSHHRAFTSIAPMLWLRAGGRGRRIEAIPNDTGWDIADTYGVLANLDNARAFTRALSKAEDVQIAFIVTDDDRRFQMVCSALPDGVQPVRLYESYLINFEIHAGVAS